MELPRAPLPKMARVRQNLPRERLDDVAGAVRAALDSVGIADRVASRRRIAITAGSRGIADIALIIRTVADHLRTLGVEPFVVPAMGSHGGATVEGQRALLAEYGITERETGVPIEATMDTVVVGTLSDGTPCHLDRNAAEADGIVVVGRVKAHTAFRGDIESGLCKMTAIGLGKQRGAELCHSRGLRDAIPAVAEVTLASGKVIAGVALVENAYHQIHTIRAVPPEQFHETDRQLLTVANELLPRVPFDELDVLVVDELGKNISGSGIDYNIVGMWRRIGGERRPDYKRIVVLDITSESEGNGLGVGIADFTTRRLYDKLDLHKTYMNGLTSGALDAIKIPVILESDREALEVALKSANAAAPPRITWIKNSLELDSMLISEALLTEAERVATLTVESEPKEILFGADGAVDWGSIRPGRAAAARAE